MVLKALSQKYYDFLVKLYKNINNEKIEWSKAVNAEYYFTEIDHKFNIRISKIVSGLVKNFYFRVFDNSNIKIIEITTEINGEDKVNFDDTNYKINDLLEEIYEWAQAFSMDIIGKIDNASNLLDKISKG